MFMNRRLFPPILSPFVPRIEVSFTPPASTNKYPTHPTHAYGTDDIPR